MSEQATTTVKGSTTNAAKWNKADTEWVLSLFGTAVGAGVLFLPIKAGLGGFWPLVVLALLAGPMTWLAHRSLARFVLSSKNPNSDITDVVEEHFGKGAAKLITFAYFFAIYPIVLIYGVGITNTFESFIVNQLDIFTEIPRLAADGAPLLNEAGVQLMDKVSGIPRWLLSGGLILTMTALILFGKELMLKATSALVYPLVFILFGLSLFLIPSWNTTMLTEVPEASSFLPVIWLSIPLIVFSFNHSPIISQFAKAQRETYGDNAVQKTDLICKRAGQMLLGFVMLFVFSCVLSLSPEQLAQAKAENISILSYLANVHDSVLIQYFGPFVAFAAITSSYFGHYLGAQEGLNGLVKQVVPKASEKNISTFSIAFIVLTTWAVAIINPSVLGLIETIGAPMIAAILFLMPMYAIKKVPAMQKYASSKAANIFVTICGLMAITSVIYGSF
ncbi:aromatic amino acid transport family protein [Moritella sp. Urea-trap-13]|uniref:aromatic amino acid transport family protein n=1 Tax=Moritella sp. Urea-trap-13 TaxID=2058327 RepID=UPI000C31D7F8|nr:aromatic amino acid transport family protein [Moritella sp. Urea-trap-13]PKH07724.1 HAAAP family serine/threonine permease [Moritella sp. Urea-trap-13]